MTIIATATNGTEFASSGELIYITPAGSITAFTHPQLGELNAIVNIGPSVTDVYVVVDGSVVSTANNTLIFLDQNTAGLGRHDVIVGSQGILRAFEGVAVHVKGTQCVVMNAGDIFAESAAILATGNGALVTNTGTITTQSVGISTLGTGAHLRNGGLIDVVSSGMEAQGDNSHLVNSGTILGGAGIRSFGDNSYVLNTGTINSDDANSFGASGGGILIEGGTGSRVVNSGQINSTSSIGVNFLGVISGTGFLRNSGAITGDLAGVSFSNGFASVSTAMTWTITNGGEISGRVAGINAQDGNLALTNSSAGQISAGAGDAITCLGLLNLTNWGTISATGSGGDGIVLGASSGFTEINNFGTISTTNGLGINAASVTVGAVFLTNHGIIQGAASAYSGGAVADVITNFGTMSAVGTGSGNDQVRNAGLISSFVILSLGNDSYDGRGGSVAGYIDGGIGNDTLRGGGIDDDLRGGVDADLLIGGDGDDSLSGSDGDDLLRGGDGDDVLQAGLGLDVLTGGLGADLFLFGSATEISVGAAIDRIRDFEYGVDIVDLSALPTLTYIGAVAFSNIAGQLRYQRSIGQLQGDLDGDGVADFILAFDGTPQLNATSLIL